MKPEEGDACPECSQPLIPGTHCSAWFCHTCRTDVTECGECSAMLCECDEGHLFGGGGRGMKPTYEELVTLLRQAPPRQMITDQRYWDWRKRVEEALARIPE
mgnify:CR=1 FL=1